MHSIRSPATWLALVTLITLITGVAAQASSTVSPTMPPEATQAFDIGPISSDEKFTWCRAQLESCPQICGGIVSTNDCTESDLSYECVCQNGTVPDVSAFKQTVPFFVCQKTYQQCVAANPRNAKGQATCEENQQCGTQDSTKLASDEDEDEEDKNEDDQASSSSDSPSQPSESAATDEGADDQDSSATLSHHTATGALVVLMSVAFSFLL